MRRATKSIAYLVLSIGTVGALAACGSPKPNAVSVPTFPSNGAPTSTESASPSSTSDTDTTTPAQSESATPGTPAAAPGTNPGSGGNQQDPQGNRGRKCAPNQLSGHLVPGSPGAGQRNATLVLSNTSGSTCTLFGYSGLSLIGADGHPLPTSVRRNATPAPSLITVPPGQSASEELHWTAVNGPGEPDNGPCEPSATSLAVIPPDQYSAISVPWHLNEVCQHGAIDATAFH